MGTLTDEHMGLEIMHSLKNHAYATDLAVESTYLDTGVALSSHIEPTIYHLALEHCWGSALGYVVVLALELDHVP